MLYLMRPFVTVNCAMSADGKIAGKVRKQVRISSPEDLDRVRSLRESSDGILVGVGTIISDDPHLTIKGNPIANNPIRIVLDTSGRTPDSAKVLDGRARTIIVTDEVCTRNWKGTETIRVGKGRVDLQQLMSALYERGIKRLMVEGGGETIFSFFEAGLVDRYMVFVGSKVIGGKCSPTPADGEGFPDRDILDLRLMEVKRLGDGVLLTYEVEGNG